MLRLLLNIEASLLNKEDYIEEHDQLNEISNQFKKNHGVSFDFLVSKQSSAEQKAKKLDKIITLVTKLKFEEDQRNIAQEKMSKYR